MIKGMQILKSREEWLKARGNTIGGSDAACLLGLNPYKSNVELWREKKGLIEPEDISDNPAVRYGTDAEPALRELFKLDHPELKVYYEPNNIVLNDDYPGAHASLDGWIEKDGQLGILEIKTALIFGNVGKWNNSIPDNYYCQVLWYMMLTDAQFVWVQALLRLGYHTGTIEEQIRQYSIERTESVEREIEMLRDAGERFCESLKGDIEPARILPPI